MSCKCDEIGDYSDCPRHGNGTEWAKKQELGEPIKRRYEREKLLMAVVECAREVFKAKRPSYHECLDDGMPECEWCLLEKAIHALDSVKEK